LRPALLGAVALMTLAPATARAGCGVIEGDRDGNGTVDLRVLGSTGRQTAVIDMLQDGYLVSIDCNGNGLFSDAVDVTVSGSATIETYSLELGGSDVVTVRLGETLTGARKNVVAVMAAFSNQLKLITQGFDLQGGTSLMIDIVGGGGSENVTLDFSGSTIDSSWVMVRGDHYAGNDTAKWIGAAHTINSVVDVDFFAGVGRNVMSYSDGGGQVVGSSIAYFAEGSDRPTDKDFFDASLGGTLEEASRLKLGVNLLFGDDSFTTHVNLAGFGIDPGAPAGSEAIIRAQGHRGFDTLSVTDGGTIGPATINGLFAVDFLGGNQRDSLFFNMRGVTGSGIVRFRGQGGIAQDVIDAKLTADASAANALDLALQGGPENDLGSPAGDILRLDITNNGGAGGLFVAGGLLDGGLDGNDRCDFTGTGTRLSSGCELGTR
jgi:hypothetical protein